MGTFVKAWSPLLAALLVVLSVIYTGMTMRTHTENIQGRLTAVEKHIESIRNAIEGNQGVIVRIATLDLRMGDKLQNLIVQRDNYMEHDEQEALNVHNEFQSLKNDVNSILNLTQRIGYIEEVLLDMQASIEDMKQQQNKARQ
jgi:hypothetical protein